MRAKHILYLVELYPLFIKFYFIPQFDLLSLGAQLFGLFTVLWFFYTLNITKIIPKFIEVKKLRYKKLTHSEKIIQETNNFVVNFSSTFCGMLKNKLH